MQVADSDHDLREFPGRRHNARPAWLELAHQKLDDAVFAAYGWPVTLSDDELLGKLLELNLQRSKSGSG